MSREDWRDCRFCGGTGQLSVNPGYAGVATYPCTKGCDRGRIPPRGHWAGDGCDTEHARVPVPCRAEVDVYDEFTGEITKEPCGEARQRWAHQCMDLEKKHPCGDGAHHPFVR